MTIWGKIKNIHNQVGKAVEFRGLFLNLIGMKLIDS